MGSVIGIGLQLIRLVMCRELPIHVIERVAGNAQRNQNLLAGCFSLAQFLLLAEGALLRGPLLPNVSAPGCSTGQSGGEGQRSGQSLPQNRVGAVQLVAPAGHQISLQAGGRGSALQCLMQLLFKIVHHGSFPRVSSLRQQNFWF